MSSATLSQPLRIQKSGISYAAIALSLLLHALLFVGYGGGQQGAIKPNPNSPVRLSFLEPVPEPPAVPDELPDPEPEPLSKPKPETKPVPKPKPVAKRVTKPVQKVVQPLPVAASLPAPTAVPQIDRGLIERKRERYLARVRSHIEAYKWYPGAARKRGIEGDVTVSFMLHHDGSTDQLIVKGAPAMLMRAAMRTVEKAMPLPAPPAGLDCPLECKFRISFHLSRP